MPSVPLSCSIVRQSLQDEVSVVLLHGDVPATQCILIRFPIQTEHPLQGESLCYAARVSLDRRDRSILSLSPSLRPAPAACHSTQLVPSFTCAKMRCQKNEALLLMVQRALAASSILISEDMNRREQNSGMERGRGEEQERDRQTGLAGRASQRQAGETDVRSCRAQRHLISPMDRQTHDRPALMASLPFSLSPPPLCCS